MRCCGAHSARIQQFLRTYWLFVGPILFASILLIPLRFDGKYTLPCRCIFAILWTISYWVVKPGPIAMTAFLPLVLMPILGLDKGKDMSEMYWKDCVMQLFIILCLSITIEEINLHKRVAYWLLRLSGPSPASVLYGFMATSYYLAYYLPDYSVVNLMVPLATAACNALEASKAKARQGTFITPALGSIEKAGGMDRSDKASSAEPISKSSRNNSKSQASGRGVANLPISVTGDTSRDTASKAEKPTGSGAAKSGRSAASNKSLSEKPNSKSEAATQSGSSRRKKGGAEVETVISVGSGVPIDPDDTEIGLRKALILACAHAALIGGTALLTASTPSLIVSNLINDASVTPPRDPRKPDEPTFPIFDPLARMSYMVWAAFAMPQSILFLVVSYLTLAVYFLGPAELGKFASSSEGAQGEAEALTAFLDEADAKLGNYSELLSDACVGVIVIFAMTMWPRYGFRDRVDSERPIQRRFGGPGKPSSHEKLLTWPMIQKKLNWALLIYTGCGFAISAAVKARGLNIHPLYMLLPCAIAPSLAFATPWGNAPMAVVYESGVLEAGEIVLTGAIVSIVCLALTLLNINTWSYWMLALHEDMHWHPEAVPKGATTVLISTTISVTNMTSAAPLS
ncbi:unnamed protein product, partial [Mesorhabditis spiculigera]